MKIFLDHRNRAVNVGMQFPAGKTDCRHPGLSPKDNGIYAVAYLDISSEKRY